jgi:hypothetical protein
MYQGDVPGSLDSTGQLPLMQGTHTGYPPRNDFPLICNETPQDADLFIVYLLYAVFTELAYFSSAHKSHL